MRFTTPLRLGLTLACLGLSACGAPTLWVEQSRAEFTRGQFIRAFESLEIAKDHDEDPGEIDRLWWPYRTASLLKHAQMLCFSNEDVSALRELAKVLVIDPDNRIAVAWTRKCKRKLADGAAREGRTKLTTGDLEGALTKFHEALAYWPGHAIADAGVLRATEHSRSRRAKAQDRYVEGVRTLAEQLFGQTQYHMAVALDSDPTLDRAEESRLHAADRLAEMCYARALEMEEEGYYAVALRDFESIEEADPDREGLRERIALVRREVEAQQLAREGELAVFRGEYTKARELIDKAFEISVSERPAYNDLLLLAREREFDQKYVLAKDIEYQGDFSAAILKYDEIERDMPGFRDVKSRLHSLHASLEAAEESYRLGIAAEESGDTAAAIQAFEDALLYVPVYRDTGTRLASLKRSARSKPTSPPTKPAVENGDSGLD